MSIAVLPGSELTAVQRDQLRESLSQRRTELRTALRLYEAACISAAPRTALVDRTRAAIVEIDLALSVVHRNRYGICEQCRQPLSLNSLTLRPLDMLCRSCEI